MRQMRQNEYEDPAEQVMFILGMKYDPKFETVLHAIAQSSNPGIVDALDYLEVHGAIHANLMAWAETVEKIHEDLGTEIPTNLKDEICRIIVDELDETHYGGKWYSDTQIPCDDWVNMRAYSPVFNRGDEAFCLPAPYFRALCSLFT